MQSVYSNYVDIVSTGVAYIHRDCLRRGKLPLSKFTPICRDDAPLTPSVWDVQKLSSYSIFFHDNAQVLCISNAVSILSNLVAS